MPIPERFTVDSDYPTLRNDDKGSIDVTVPGSISVPSNTVAIYSTVINVGGPLSELRVRIKSSKIGDRYFAAYLGVNRTGVGGSVYQIYCMAARINATQIRCSCYIPNPYGLTLVGAAGAETFTFKLDTFVSPF